MRRIIILNQKGGVGKTTTTANLGACLAERGRRVLLLDVDPQANLSLHFGHETEPGDPSLYTLMRGEHTLAEVTRDTMQPGLRIVPSSIDLAGLSVELAGRQDRLFVLREATAELGEEFDYVLMDSPPSLGLLTINAMCAAQEVFIPLQTEFFALQGLSKLTRTVGLVSSKANTELRITGVIATMHDARTCLAKEILDEIHAHFGERVFATLIRKNIRLAEAPGFGLPITRYDEECNGTRDYRALADEVLAMEAAAAVPPAPAVPTAAAAAAAPAHHEEKQEPGLEPPAGPDAGQEGEGQPGARREHGNTEERPERVVLPTARLGGPMCIGPFGWARSAVAERDTTKRRAE